MNRDELTQNYWNYYLMLEQRVADTSPYVTICKENFGTFSDTYALMLQAIGAELDCVFKAYCGFATTERKTIADYVAAIDAKERSQAPCTYPIRDQVIVLQKEALTLQPFKGWDASSPASSLPWWKAFTDIKHNRYGNRKLANQENVLNILAALFLLEMLFLQQVTEGTDELDIFERPSSLFTLRDWTFKAVPLSGAFGILG